MLWCCRCPSNTSATFLWRKLPQQNHSPSENGLSDLHMLHGPKADADDAKMDAWLDAYRAAVNQAVPDVDPEAPEGTPAPKPSEDLTILCCWLHDCFP